MSYTRRSLLRDAAAASVAGIIPGTAATFLLSGCKKSPAPSAPQPETAIKGPTPADIAPGCHIFFSGTWLFCSDGKGGMYAMSRNMSSVGHIFPYGLWSQNYTTPRGFDEGSNKLTPNPNNKQGTVNPYQITADTLATPQLDVDCLFTAAAQQGFAYIKNTAKNEIVIDGTEWGMVRIALPIPTSIITAGFLNKASYSVPNGLNVVWKPGLATTHIFEYANTNLLTFSESAAATAKVGDHLHFHTAPEKVDINRPDHGPDMFKNLINAITYNGTPLDTLKLAMSDSEPTNLSCGTHLSGFPSVNSIELELGSLACAYRKDRTGDIASCSGSGFGVGGDPCSC
jgi:hypothetical protein